jgi:hypothetical protein
MGMSLVAGKNGALYLAQYDISGKVNRFEPSLSRPLTDVTCMQASGHAWAPTLHDDSLSFDGFYESDTDIITILNSMRTATAVTLCSLSMGITQGKSAISGEGAWSEDYPIDIPVDDIIRVTGSFKFHGLARAGYVLQAKATQTEDGSCTAVDDGAASSAGAEAYLHVFSCDVPDLVIKVQTDTAADFLSPTDLITFTTVTGATSERKTVTGAVEEFVRVNYAGTWTGAKTASFAVIWARL